MLIEKLGNNNFGTNGINEIQNGKDINKEKTNLILKLFEKIGLYNKDLLNIIISLKLPECDNIIEISKYLYLIKYNNKELNENDLLDSIISELFNTIDKIDIISALKIIEYGLGIQLLNNNKTDKFISKAEDIIKNLLGGIKEEIINIQRENFSNSEEEIIKQISKLIYIFHSDIYKNIKKCFDEEMGFIVEKIITFCQNNEKINKNGLLKHIRDTFPILKVYDLITFEFDPFHPH